MNGLPARVCSIQDPQPSFVSATRGHRDATWRPGAMDADWDEVSRSPRPFPDHPAVFPAPVQSLRAGTESCATRQTPRSPGVADCELWTADCGLRIAGGIAAQRRAITEVLTRMSTVESSTPPSTGRAVGANRRHRARLRFKPGAPMGWKRICMLDPTDASGPPSPIATRILTVC